MLGQSDGEGAGTAGDLASEVGNEIKVTLDRWSVGQLGVGDLIVAGAVLVAGGLLAWLASRVAKRIARRNDGAARAAVATIGLLLGSSIMLLAIAITFEVLGFGLGPILVLILLVVAALLLLRPLMTNLSSGLLLQLRGALAAGDLILTNGVLGTVREINARSVVLETPDGRQVHVPNADALDGTIENYSALGRRRSSFDLAFDASVDIQSVTTAIERAVVEVDGVVEEPAPTACARAVVSRFVLVRVFVWHPPTVAAATLAVDGAIEAVVRLGETAGIALDGPDVVVWDSRSDLG